MNERDETFRWLGIVYKERSLEFRTLRYSPIDPGNRKDPRYAAIFERAGPFP